MEATSALRPRKGREEERTGHSCSRPLSTRGPTGRTWPPDAHQRLQGRYFVIHKLSSVSWRKLLKVLQRRAPAPAQVPPMARASLVLPRDGATAAPTLSKQRAVPCVRDRRCAARDQGLGTARWAQLPRRAWARAPGELTARPAQSGGDAAARLLAPIRRHGHTRARGARKRMKSWCANE